MLPTSVYSRHLAGGNFPGIVEFPPAKRKKEGEREEKGKELLELLIFRGARSLDYRLLLTVNIVSHNPAQSSSDNTPS